MLPSQEKEWKMGVPLEQHILVGSKARWTPLCGATGQYHLLITQEPEGLGMGMRMLLSKLNPGGFRPLKELCTMSGHQQTFQWGMLNKPPEMLNKSSSPPPKSGCLVLAPKKLCSFKKPWEVVMKQQESLAESLGHTSGTQVTGNEKSPAPKFLLAGWTMTHEQRSHTEWFKHAAR